jgi:hypothetical protein
MIANFLCALWCRIVGHDDRTQHNILFDSKFETLNYCHRCGRLEWK